MDTTIAIIIAVACAIVFGLLGFILGGQHRKKTAEKTIGSATQEATRILNQAMSEAEARKREAILEAKDEIAKSKAETDAELRERRAEVQRQERRVSQREEALDKKHDAVDKKSEQLAEKLKSAETKLAEAENIKKKQLEELEKISGLTIDQAKEILLGDLDEKLAKEKSARILEYQEQVKQESDEIAREVITRAIQRCSADVTTDEVLTAVTIPDDSVKGRIIGREGRNIKTFEQVTGVDLIVDDTPETIVISCFDPVRREIARITLEKLIVDGRIQVSRIEQIYEKAKIEVEHVMRKAGEKAALEAGVPNLSKEEIRLLGSLKFRTSYGQNVLSHSLEVSHLCALLATELGVDVKTAKRAGLLHDIGKAVDHQQEGTHIDLGVEIAKKCHENETIINAIAAHHGDVEPKSLVAILVQAADAISASRPGSRRENLQNYIKRLQDLERIAESFKGVDKAYAIQAGREIRVIVSPEKISDAEMPVLGRDIALSIENELTYPGQIKVNIIREKRFQATAK